MYKRTRIAYFLYSLLFYLALPLVILRLVWRSRKQPAYRQRIKERFGFVTPASKKSIWIHSVSVGESIAAMPMIKKIVAQHPECNVHVTTTTPGGSEQITTHLGDLVTHSYLPFDVPHLLVRFIKRIKPVLYVGMETEIWPNLLRICQRRHIPSLVANGRLSEKSFHNYARVFFFSHDMFGFITHIAAQSELDAQHYAGLGVPKNKISITGSIKFDRTIPTDITTEATALRHHWQLSERPVIVAASTRDGEEPYLIDAYITLKKTHPETFLFLIPRHPDRAKLVAELCQKRGFKTQFRSEVSNDDPLNCDILIGNTIGELFLFYALGDIAFVGGSLVNVGCHNVLEPAALAMPIITGPYLRNFKTICAMLQHANGQLVVHNADELSNAFKTLIEQPDQRKTIGHNALTIYESNKGATQKHLDIIKQLLDTAANTQV